MKNNIDSCVIVHNQFGSVATIRFTDSKKDRIISSSRQNIYAAIEEYISRVLNG